MISTASLFLAAIFAASWAEFDSRDGLLTEARVTAGSGTAPATVGQTDVQLGASVLWSVGSNVALGVAATNEAGQLTPAVSARWQLLSQEAVGLNATGIVRFKSVGFDSSGSEVEVETAFGRTFGRVTFLANGVAGKGFGSDTAVDLEAKSAIRVALADTFQVGLEGRLRSEVALGREVAQLGREYDFQVGPTVSFRADYMYVQAIVGWGAVRGTSSPGAIAMALVGCEL